MRHKCTYGNMAESKLLCVRADTLLRSKYASITKSDVIRQYVSELSRFYSIVLDICQALITAQAKTNNIAIALAITKARTS